MTDLEIYIFSSKKALRSFRTIKNIYSSEIIVHSKN